MSGGGGGGVPLDTAQAAPAAPSVPVADFQAFAPGQQGLLAQQMQAGYGGLLDDHMGAMGHYRDMRVPLINSPGDISNYLQNVGLPVTEGGSPANPAAFYQATSPGYVAPPTPVTTPVTPTVTQTTVPRISRGDTRGDYSSR